MLRLKMVSHPQKACDFSIFTWNVPKPTISISGSFSQIDRFQIDRVVFIYSQLKIGKYYFKYFEHTFEHQPILYHPRNHFGSLNL